MTAAAILDYKKCSKYFFKTNIKFCSPCHVEHVSSKKLDRGNNFQVDGITKKAVY